MNPNPQIYGAPETWQNNFMFGGLTTSVTTVLHAVRPKCATWGSSADYSSSQLRSGITAEKLTQNQPIDKSIVAVGQGKASAFKSIAIYHLDGSNHLILDNVARPNGGDVINGVFGDFSSRGSYGVAGNNSCSRGLLDWYKKSARVWSPDSANVEGNDRNGNYFISPFVYYESRSILLQIEVAVCNSETVPDNPSAVPASTWRSLEDWKTTYSTHKIVGIRIKGLSLNAYSASTGDMTYAYTTYDSSASTGYSHSIVWSPLDGIEIANHGEYYLYALFNSSATSGLVTMGYNTTPLYKWEGQSQYYVLMPFYDEFKDYIKHYTDDNVGGRIWYQIPYSDDIYETIMQACACFGCPFTPTATRVFNQAFTHTDLCLPIINDSGVANGEYTRGTDNVNNDFIDLRTPWDKNYNPSAPVDTNTYSITTGFNTVGNVASTTKQYVINANALQGLSGELWSVVGDLITNPDDLKNLDNLSLDAFLTSNPIDAIVSVKKFPLSSVPHGESLENIYLGKYQTSAAGYSLALQQARYNFEGIPIFPKFGNCFLDYSPYTKMQLYVPFCGTIDIDAADFMGRTLSVEMVIDFITGSVTAYVLANQLVVTSLTGTCAIDIPITGTEQATVNSAYESATIAERQARKNEIMQTVGIFTHPIKTATKPLTTAAERVSTALDRAQREYELTHINMPLRQIGQASPLNSWALEFVCRLIIYYPDGECISFNATNEPTLLTDKVQAFGAVNGFATVETNTLSNFTGFTQVSDADLTGISATDTEKEMIINLLQSGIYL